MLPNFRQSRDAEGDVSPLTHLIILLLVGRVSSRFCHSKGDH